MTKISNRLKAIASFLSLEDCLVDVGCDHGLLSIYLVENHLVQRVVASDINPNALSSAIANISSRNMSIETVLSDGIESVNLDGIQTLVISGMGTGTILHILRDEKKLKKIKKIVIQSNNDYELLRKSMNQKGYYLEEESYTFDKKKWYVTCKFVKRNQVNTSQEVKYGFLDNLAYNQFLLEQEYKIFKRIPITSISVKFQSFLRIKKLKKAIANVSCQKTIA